MARIVKLGELLPEDFIIELPDGEQHTLPGDPPLQLILKIAELFERSSEAEVGDEGVGLEILRELDEQVLGLLRMREPEIESSPFGVLGVQHVVGALLHAYNFGEAEEEPSDEEDPPKPASKSKRSSGSPSSSTSSASRRTTTSGSAGRRSKRSNA